MEERCFFTREEVLALIEGIRIELKELLPGKDNVYNKQEIDDFFNNYKLEDFEKKLKRW